MKHHLKTASLTLALFIAPLSAGASIYDITPDMQICSENADCTAISDSCTKACETLPVNSSSAERLKSSRVQTCGADVEKLPACEMHPPLEPRCVNNRCTVGFAFDNNADDSDYGRKAGSYSGAKPGGKTASSGVKPGYDDGPRVLQLPEGYKAVPAQEVPAAQERPAVENQ
jgi:hypothetical protein